MKEIDFYFDFISPYSYLAAIQLHKFEAEHDVIMHWIPINLPKLISVSGNTPPSRRLSDFNDCSEKSWG